MTGPVLCCYRCLAPLQGGSASGMTPNNCRNAFDHGLLFHAACVGEQCPLCPADATARHAVNLLGASALAKVAFSAANGAPADAAGQGGLDPAFLQEVQRLARAHDESDDKPVGTVGLKEGGKRKDNRHWTQIYRSAIPCYARGVTATAGQYVRRSSRGSAGHSCGARVWITTLS